MGLVNILAHIDDVAVYLNFLLTAPKKMYSRIIDYKSAMALRTKIRIIRLQWKDFGKLVQLSSLSPECLQCSHYYRSLEQSLQKSNFSYL